MYVFDADGVNECVGMRVSVWEKERKIERKKERERERERYQNGYPYYSDTKVCVGERNRIWNIHNILEK